MLQPANRLTLIDAMRPPAGFEFESAMAVTYTLDLRALLAAPAAMALTNRADDRSEAGDGRHESIELIHALRSHASKLTVFSQAGEIALPPSRRVFAFLERAVVPVTAPRHGIVHPKVWVLRYVAASDPPDGTTPERRLRVLIASRNLTFDESWDTVVRLDETTGSSGATLKPVGKLFDRLLGRCPADVSEDHRTRVQSLAAALRAARFARPAGVDDLQVHVLGLTDTPSPLPSDAERSLIISPFVSDGFFTRVHPSPVGELVSSQEQLDGLDAGSLAAVGKVQVFDDGSAPDFSTGNDQRSSLDPGQALVGLHAKVFAFEREGRASLFLGSANATDPAFGSNVEVLVELNGPVEALGIDQLCGGTDDERGLRHYFYDYRRGEPEPPGEETSLDHHRRAIARLPIKGYVNESGSEWAVTYRSVEPMPALEDVSIHCWPLSTAGNRRQVSAGEPLEARFETSLENLSGFLALELAHDDGTTSSFVVPAALVGVPEQRERLLLRLLIGNAERFFRYLMALLEEDATELSLLDTIERISDEPATPDGNGSVSLPVLEKLLRTMRRDPAKLISLHPLVSDLTADDALPPGFAELWEMIHDVATAGEADQ